MKVSNIDEVNKLLAEQNTIRKIMDEVDVDSIKVYTPNYQIQLHRVAVEKIVNEINVGYTNRLSQIRGRLLSLEVDPDA